MSPETADGSMLRFGTFELDLNGREIRKSGVLVKLRPQAFRVLTLLASRSGQMVTREQLQKEIWNDGSIVDFEQGLNFCIRQIRVVLGDDADSPRFIETIPRRGYRFLVPVTAIGPAPAPAVTALPPARPHPVPLMRLAVAGVAAFAGLLVWYFWTGKPTPVPSIPGPSIKHAVPLTSYPGFERNPALSPEGNQVAFTWDGEKRDNFDIYIKPIGPGALLRLTTNPAEDVNPAYSPDGRTIAFFRRLSGGRNELLLIPTSGEGTERKLAETRCGFRPELCSLAWSPDGRWLAVTHREPGDPATGLFMISALTGDQRRLTARPGGLYGDFMPAFSPDGRTLAFTRLHGYAAGDVYLLPLTGDFQPSGEPRRLTASDRGAISPVWTGDGRRIVYLFAEGHEAPHELRIIATSGPPTSDRVLSMEDDISGVSLGRHLVYSRESHDTNIWRAEIGPPGTPLSVPQLLISSTRHDGLPRYSPDGKKIAFGSTRSGTWEIWMAEADGSNPLQLTFFGGPHVAVMGWSPDGRQLVFHGFRALPEGQFDLFTMPSAGGAPKRLTAEPFDGFSPSYSHDGRWIYFSSRRSGRMEIWKIPAGREERAGQAIQITHADGGSQALESPDGKTLYYCHEFSDKGIWKVPVEGGKAVQVTGPSARMGCGLAVTAEGFYYTPAPDSRNQRSIQFVSFSTGQSRPVVVSDRSLGMSLSVSPDQRFIVYSPTDQSGSDLMLIENFAVR